MNSTNYINISERRIYLITFYQKIQLKQESEHIKFMNGFRNLLKTLVKKAPDSFKPTAKPNENQIRFELPKWTDVNTDYNFYLSNEAAKIVEDYLYNMFWTIFELHMRKLSKVMTMKNAVYLFIENYDLSVDRYEMLIRRDRRKRKSLIPKKTVKIASAFSVFLSFSCPLITVFLLIN